MPLHTYQTVFELDSTEIGNVRRVQAPEHNRSTVDVTVLKSANMAKAFIRSWKEHGELTFTVLHASAIRTTLVTAFNLGPSGADSTFKFEFPLDAGETTPADISGSGLVTKVGTSEAVAGEDGVFETEVTIKPTGDLTYTAAT